MKRTYLGATKKKKKKKKTKKKKEKEKDKKKPYVSFSFLAEQHDLTVNATIMAQQ